MTPLEHAFADLAVREVPPGRNRGPRVDLYQLRVGLPVPSDPSAKGHPWCCAAMYTWFHESGRWFPRTASVHRFAELAKAHRVPQGQPWKQGDVAVHFSSETKGHIVMLNLDKGGAWEDISGNTDVKGDREGDGVYLITRPLRYYHQVFRL